jgi:hypothetical protein
MLNGSAGFPPGVARRSQAVLALSAVGLGCACVAARGAAAVAGVGAGVGAARDRRARNPDIAAQYAAEGFVSPVRVLSASGAAEALAQLNAWAAATFKNGEVVGDLRFKPHLFLPFVSRLVRHPAILDTVQAALGTENLVLWSSDRPAGSGGFFSAHQDATFTGLAPAERGVTVWLALSEPVDEAHGCMVFWPTSHLRGQLKHLEEPERDANNMLSRGQRVEDALEQSYSPFVAELHAGEASLHHFHLVHKSGPNGGTSQRVGLAMRYIAADVRQTGRVRECVTLVRGQMEHDGFDLEPQLPANATAEDVEAGMVAHADAMRRETANYFDTAEGIEAYDGHMKQP